MLRNSALRSLRPSSTSATIFGRHNEVAEIASSTRFFRSGTSADQQVAEQLSKDGPSHHEQISNLKPMSEIPRPTASELLRGFFKFLDPKIIRNLHNMQLENAQKYGKMSYMSIPIPMVNVYEPELAEKALRNQGAMPSRGGSMLPWTDYRKERAEKLGLLTSDGEEWKKYRMSMAKKIMPPRHVQGFAPAMMETIDDQIENLAKCAERFASKDALGRRIVEELPNEMYKWAMESIGTVIFETRLGCLDDPPPPETQGFIDAIAENFATVQSATLFYNLQKKIGSPYVKRQFASLDIMFAFVRKIVERRKEELLELAKTTEVSNTEGAILTYLLLDESLDDADVIGNVTDLLTAGVDTTSNTLVWAVYNLSRNPERLRRLETEIHDVIGAEKAPTVQSIHKMPFLKNCIKETLRMYPVVIFLARTIEHGMELGGYFLPKDTLVVHNLYSMCMSEKYFEEPHLFNPDRWDRDAGKKFHPFSSLPFAYGPRSCIGKRLAEMEMHLMLARIVQKFELRPVTSLPEVTPVMRALLTPPIDQLIPVEFIRK